MKKISQKEEIYPHGGDCWPFLNQNTFSLARFALPELIPARGCGENDGLYLF